MKNSECLWRAGFIVWVAGIISFPLHASEIKIERIELPEITIEEAAEEGAIRTVHLRGLDKVTARSTDLIGPVGTVIRFGALEIIPQRCWSAPPEAREEHSALLEILERKEGGEMATKFHGWMFTASPAISVLEHPVYDITLVKCSNEKLQENPLDDSSKRTQESSKEASQEKITH